MPNYEDVVLHFREHTGLEHVSDMLTQWTNSSTHVVGYLLSGQRAVTVDWEPYSLMLFGPRASITLHVWEGCQLTQTMFVPIDLLFQAAREPYIVHRHEYRNKEVMIAIRSHNILSLEAYYEAGDGERYDEHGLQLTRDEFQFLCSRLEPLQDYEPKPEWKEE